MCLVTTGLVYTFPVLKADGALSWGDLLRVVMVQVAYDFAMNLMFVSMVGCCSSSLTCFLVC